MEEDPMHLMVNEWAPKGRKGESDVSLLLSRSQYVLRMGRELSRSREQWEWRTGEESSGSQSSRTSALRKREMIPIPRAECDASVPSPSLENPNTTQKESMQFSHGTNHWFPPGPAALGKPEEIAGQMSQANLMDDRRQDSPCTS